MKRLLCLVLIVFLFSGCSSAEKGINEAISLRQRLLSGNGCTFDGVIYANYTDYSHRFALRCQANQAGELTFSVLEPNTIDGITGKITAAGGDLRFDDSVLVFDTLADGLLSPVSTPWIFLKGITGGYVHACEKDGDALTVIYDDTYRGGDIRIHVRLDDQRIPEFCEIYWQGQRYLSMDVTNFVFL